MEFQFVEELAPVKIAWLVNTKTVKVRSDIKDGCFTATTEYLAGKNEVD
ncbi:hypothetical protein CR513_39112, partial [Mucuna pruriens]